MNFINRDLRAQVSGFLLVLLFSTLFSAFCCPQAVGQCKLTYFEGEIDGLSFLGYSKGKWYFSSDEHLFIYDKSMKLQTKSKYKLPKGWGKTIIMNRRMVNGSLICLGALADNKEDEREFMSFKIADDGNLELVGDGGKALFKVDERNKAVAFSQLSIDPMNRKNTATFGRHLDWAISRDTSWMVIQHEQEFKDSDKEKKRLLTYFVLDREYRLVNNFTHTVDKKEGVANFNIDNSGLVFMIQILVEKVNRKQTDRNRVLVQRCALDRTKFKSEEIDMGSTDVFHAHLFHFEGHESRLVCLGRNNEDTPSGIDRLVVHRFDTKKEGFVLEYNEDIWKLKGMGKPPEAYEPKSPKHVFRLLGCFFGADNQLIVLFDDYSWYTVTHTSKNGVTTTVTYHFADYVYAARLGSDSKTLDYFLSHRFLMNAVCDYTIVQKEDSGELHFYLNDDPKRYGPKAKKPSKVSRRNLYSPGMQDLLARYIYTPGKGFKNEVILSLKEAKKAKFVTQRSACHLGGNKYLTYVQYGRMAKKHFPVIIEI